MYNTDRNEQNHSEIKVFKRELNVVHRKGQFNLLAYIRYICKDN